MKKEIYSISFHCFFPGNPVPTKHFQDLTISQIPKWIEAYKFTHPACESITFKIWFSDMDLKN